jgi:3-deoxy-D-manno-octulosonic-acid transferase
MLVLYNVLFTIGLFFYFPVLLLKKGPEDRRTFIKERLGISNYHKTEIWVHAVSVGETLACLPFLKKLKKEFPHKKIVLSTTTYTGQKIAREKFPEADRIMYMPLDTMMSMKRVVNSLKPEVFITVETELWPALFHTLKKAGSRIIILNGRISNESFKGYQKINFLIKKVLSNVDFFYMQDKLYAERIIALGADRHKVGVMGNFKFDLNLDTSAPPTWLNFIKGRILLAASTHRGEEEIILEAFSLIKRQIPDLKLILAPRHPERFSEVAELIEKVGFKYIRRSELIQQPSTSNKLPATADSGQQIMCCESPELILLDTIGELSRVFSKVSIAFIGGSLVPVGGHNILEPAYWAKPIIFGPYMDNFPIATEFIENNAAMRVRNAEDIVNTVTTLIQNNIMAANMGHNAREIVDKNTGAVKKAVELVRGFIGTV